jgi:hypothetical protein
LDINKEQGNKQRILGFGERKPPLDSLGVLFLLLIAAAFIYIGILFSNPSPDRQQWQTTVGQVTKIEWGYKIHKVTISYQVLGKTYSETELSGVTAFPPHQGETVTVRYNPKDPSFATREPGLYNGSWQLFVGASILVAAILLAIAQKRRLR